MCCHGTMSINLSNLWSAANQYDEKTLEFGPAPKFKPLLYLTVK